MLTTATKIKIELLKKGIAGVDIAREEHVSRAAISRTIKGDLKSERLRKAIARALGMRVEELWLDNNHPERALRNGASKKAA